MPRIEANGIEIEYEEYGKPDDPMLLLVSGFSGQMITWPDAFKQGLAEAGRRVVIFDNRDIGLSTEFTNEVPPAPRDIVKGVMAGEPMHEKVPYILNDMAADAAGLVQALGANKADVMGFSMGGMIVQLMALNHPERVRTLIPVMTTSGDPALPPATPEAQQALTAVPEVRNADAIGDLAAQSRRVIGSHETVRNSDEAVKAMAIRAFERSDRPMGVARQYAAILAQPRWHERLAGVSHPTLVLHGAQDPLIRPAAGQDIAERIPGAEIEIIEKWGHDLPEKMVPVLLNRIVPFLGKHVPEEARADVN
ncbi:alpha/beta fold hydrolase [Henriciella mobilis]|uniref:Alpha/beta hydrolase n=1 Tax=Henriciella mobilis TaxID=2305467 RepID=A0A399R604_9PROT|nr:alpha/beta hydrolase [Henriciella mobilis]RIJ14777.1 alpha/beta hydrolase [Henriciella mobilis]RIJ21733.1 alpha/beta hydrolase [Henriciella mobilis]RIJ26768.1 alpha/beta hydrolase [Henriciella mobilis]